MFSRAQLRPRYLAVFLWTTFVVFHSSSSVDGSTCPVEEIGGRYDSLKVIDYSDAIMEPLCTDLRFPGVIMNVLPPPPERDSNEVVSKLYWRYSCNGSTHVTKSAWINFFEDYGVKFSPNIEQVDDGLAVGDRCVIYTCFAHIVSTVSENSGLHKAVFYSSLEEATCVMDIDECERELDACEHYCIDRRTGTPNSYQCGCRKGYRLAEDHHRCTDVDECNEGSDNCDQICTTNSSSAWFNCSCTDGFYLDEDGHTCNDINECEVRNGTELCETETTGLECNNIQGGYQCLCPEGYKLNNTNTCIAIDVCEEDNINCGSHASCVNSPEADDGYTCECDPGYFHITGQTTCSPREIVHVYWTVPVLLILMLTMCCGIFVRHKYIQHKNDMENRYKELFRYSGRAEKLDPSHKPVEPSPLKKITYAFSLISTLEFLGHRSHVSLNEACNEELKERESAMMEGGENLENDFRMSEEEERVRRELSAIIRGSEHSMSDGENSGFNSPTQAGQFLQPGFITGDYVDEHQITKSGCHPDLAPGSKRESQSITNDGRETHVKNVGYVNEQSLSSENISFSPPELQQEDPTLLDEILTETETPEGCRQNFRALEKNRSGYQWKQQRCCKDSAIDVHSKRGESKERSGSPSPSEYSMDTVFSMTVPPPPTKKHGYINDIDTSGYELEIDAKCLKTEGSKAEASVVHTKRSGISIPAKTKGRARTTLSSGYLSESGASEYSSHSSGHHVYGRKVLPRSKPPPSSSGSYLEDSVFSEGSYSEDQDFQHLPLYPPPSTTNDSRKGDTELTESGSYRPCLNEDHVTSYTDSHSEVSAAYNAQEHEFIDGSFNHDHGGSATKVPQNAYVNTLSKYEIDSVKTFETPSSVPASTSHYANLPSDTLMTDTSYVHGAKKQDRVAVFNSPKRLQRQKADRHQHYINGGVSNQSHRSVTTV